MIITEIIDLMVCIQVTLSRLAPGRDRATGTEALVTVAVPAYPQVPAGRFTASRSPKFGGSSNCEMEALEQHLSGPPAPVRSLS